MSLEPRPEASLEFLLRYAPEGPWVLTSIEPDRKGIETQTFGPASSGTMLEWLQKWGGRRNIYFGVNKPLRSLSKKAERADIAEVGWLHVDIDPRVGEDLDEERKRILALLSEALPDTVPTPTVVVFSGGGYQGFWRLEAPIKIDGELERAETAKLYNLQLERLFGADNCHNVDRIMRLPGTINVPDAKKLKKGRKPALAEVVSWSGAVYPLSKFTPAQQVQGKEEGFGNVGTVEISGNVARFSSVDEIETQHPLSDRCKVLILQGVDPEDPTKYPSRSEVLWSVVCELVRCGASDDAIFSVITDPEFAVSKSVLGQGSNASRYAIRQIERAKEHAINPWLAKMNARFAVVENMGGACRVIEEVEDPALGRTQVSKQTFQDFRHRFMHVKVEKGVDPKGRPVQAELGDWWLRNERRRQYERVIFAPGRDVPGSYNLWHGFAVEARPGDCGLFLEHIRENLCCGVQEHYDYLIGWMATAVQRPDEQGHTAVVLRGKEGTGKSFFADTFGSLFGRHYIPVSNAEHVTGKFNAHLRDCVVLFGDEAFYAGDKQHEGILKALITQDTIQAEGKFIDTETVRNYTHLILASNKNWIVPAGPEARRYFVLDVNPAHMQDGEYFQRIKKQLDSGGREALLYFLQNYKLEGFSVREVPQTKALQEQKLLSLGIEEDWWKQKLDNGRLLSIHERWLGRVRCCDLVDDYVSHAQRMHAIRRSTETGLGLFLARVCPTGWPQKGRHRDQGSKRSMFYVFPSLQECRDHWDRNFGGPFTWIQVEDSTDEPEQEHF